MAFSDIWFCKGVARAGVSIRLCREGFLQGFRLSCKGVFAESDQ